MKDEDNKTEASLSKIITLAFGLPWFEIIGELWKIGRKLMRGLSNEGVYEVLEYECRLELLDKKGENALIQKREKVRYLQDNIIAYQDQAWGDGKILLDYRCSPGVPVDQYQLGPKQHVLISLRDVRNKGDMDEFNIEWKVQNSFLKKTESWGTSINHLIRRVNVQIVFPKNRPPLKVSIFERNLQRSHTLSKDALRKLPDGRWIITWENTNPRLYENYMLSWEW